MTGHYSETLHIYAASAALKLAIKGYCPPTGIHTNFVSDSLNRKICGHGVAHSYTPALIVMWSQGVVPNREAEFRPNHFVILALHHLMLSPCTLT